MARPPKTTAEHELSGAFEKNPKRRRARENEPKPTGPLGDPPEHLTREESAIWNELTQLCAPGVLKNSDRLHVELVCTLMARKRKDGIGGRAGLNNGELNTLGLFLAKVGMNPADRTKIGVTPEKQKDSPFKKFAQPSSGAIIN
jgi:hypothetical protein